MHRHRLLLSVLAIGAMAVGCGGNNGGRGGTEGAAGTSGATNAPGGSAMTLRGCVENGTPGGTYVLRTREAEAGTEGAAGTSGGSPDRGGADVNRTTIDGEGVYRLIATGNVDIGQNVGKEVAVTGQIATQAQDQTGAGSSGAGSGSMQGSAHDNAQEQRRGTSGENAGGQFFRVTSMTKVSDSCSMSGAGDKSQDRNAKQGSRRQRQ